MSLPSFRNLKMKVKEKRYFCQYSDALAATRGNNGLTKSNSFFSTVSMRIKSSRSNQAPKKNAKNEKQDETLKPFKTSCTLLMSISLNLLISNSSISKKKTRFNYKIKPCSIFKIQVILSHLYHPIMEMQTLSKQVTQCAHLGKSALTQIPNY